MLILSDVQENGFWIAKLVFENVQENDMFDQPSLGMIQSGNDHVECLIVKSGLLKLPSNISF